VNLVREFRFVVSAMATAYRYIVSDVAASVAFFVDELGFALEQQFGPNMAIVSKDDARGVARRAGCFGLTADG
jgi:catechol 2,3-dioxygenase-like lactoylglutathione lyase family enzyme